MKVLFRDMEGICEIGEKLFPWRDESGTRHREESFRFHSVVILLSPEIEYARIYLRGRDEVPFFDEAYFPDRFTGEFQSKREIGMVVSLFPTYFITYFLLHEYHHLFRLVFELVEESEEDGGGNVVGDISYDRIRRNLSWSIFQDISFDDIEARFWRDNQISFVDS